MCGDISAVRILYVRGGSAKLCCSPHTFQPGFVICALLLFRKLATVLRLETDADKKNRPESTFTSNALEPTLLFNFYVNRLIIGLSFTFKMMGKCQGASWVHILFII